MGGTAEERSVGFRQKHPAIKARKHGWWRATFDYREGGSRLPCRAQGVHGVMELQALSETVEVHCQPEDQLSDLDLIEQIGAAPDPCF